RFVPMLRIALTAVVVLLAIGALLGEAMTLKAFAGLAAAAWVGGGTIAFVLQRIRHAPAGRRFTAEMAGMLLAHGGVAVFFLGVLMTEGLSIEKDVALGSGEHVEVAGYDFRFDGVRRVQGPNYRADRGDVTVLHDGQVVAVLHPEKRGYASGGQ